MIRDDRNFIIDHHFTISSIDQARCNICDACVSWNMVETLEHHTRCLEKYTQLQIGHNLKQRSKNGGICINCLGSVEWTRLAVLKHLTLCPAKCQRDLPDHQNTFGLITQKSTQGSLIQPHVVRKYQIKSKPSYESLGPLVKSQNPIQFNKIGHANIIHVPDLHAPKSPFWKQKFKPDYQLGANDKFKQPSRFKAAKCEDIEYTKNLISELKEVLVKRVEVPQGILVKPREHQLTGLAWLVNNEINYMGGILADEMGLGKTFQMILLMSYHLKPKDHFGTLIVVPPAVINQWKEEIIDKGVVGHHKVLVYHGSQRLVYMY